MRINCNNCIFISNTEEQQQENKEGHRCLTYKHRLYHFRSHPLINPCEKCKNDNYVNYIEKRCIDETY